MRTSTSDQRCGAAAALLSILSVSRWRAPLSLTLLASAALAWPTVQLQAQGSLDPTFNGTGKVVTNFGGEDRAAGIAIQADGKIVVAGTVGTAIGVARYLSNGALDTSFSGDGLVTTSVGFNSDSVSGIAIQSDGKIVVCASSNFGSNDTRFSMVRLNTDGTLDTTFDTDGKVNTSLGANSDLCNAIGLQSDGKIVLAGYANSLNPLFAAARYNTNGSLDTTFDTDGIATVSAIGTNGDQCYGMTIQADGKIVLVGGSVVGANFDTTLARLNTNGTLDTTFSGDGKHITSVLAAADLAFGVAQQADGKLVLTGYALNGSTEDLVTLRYTTAGAPDATWDGDGIKLTTVPSATHERGRAVTIQADQKIVVTGIARFTSPSTQYDIALFRFNSNSTLDTTFDTDGIVTTPVGSWDDLGNAVKLQADGRIVVAGDTQNTSFVNDFVVARYLNSVPVPEIGVEQPAGTGLTDGSSTVAFGTTSVNTSLMRTFTITNSGTGTLSGLAVTKDGADQADFTVGSLGATSIAPGSTTTFTVTFTPSSAAAKVAAIHIASDDLDENPFDITLNGTGALIPEIVVEQPAGTALTDGTSSINCGSAPVNTPATAVVFTIKNIGSADMTGIAVTKDGTHSAEFAIDTTGMLTTVPAGQQTTFTVTATPGAAGVRTAAIHIASDDLDENPFDIGVTSTGLIPEIAVEQPVSTNLTDGVSSIGFGTGLTGSTSAAKVFTIKNTGLADLTGVAVTKDGAGSADYTVDTTGMTTTVAPGGSTTFSVTFTPSVLGARPAALHISSNDGDENPFDIALTGEGVIPSQVAQEAYGKASNTGAGDLFGASVAISGDTVVVGAYAEDSDTVLINGNQASNTAADAGAVYVFTRSAGVWTQQAYIKPFNTNAGDQFGYAVAIDGDTLVVGANLEDSNATTINGDGNNNSALQSGAAYVFTRSGTTWSQQAYLKPFNTGADDQFGNSVSVSGDSIVVGAYLEDSNATGINGNGADNSVNGFGAAYVFTRSAGVWSQQAYLKGSHTGVLDQFGISVAISGDTVVVGEYGDDSNASGVNGDASNNSLQDSGAAFVFTRTAGVWSQQAYLKASNPGSNAGAGDLFGFSSAIDGDTIVIGSYREDSNAAGVGGNQADNSLTDAGAAYVFTRSAGLWSQQAYLKASNPGLTDQFGRSVAVSGDTIVVSANQEDSAATGVLGDQASNGAGDSGAAYVFIRGGSTWLQQAYLKASNTGATDLLGNSVGVSGGTVIAGAHAEDSNATGIGGNQADNSLSNSGAVYIFTGLGPADITVEQPVGTPLTDGGTLNVGDQGIGVSGPPKTFTITNNGISQMLGIAVTKDGTHAADYALDTSGMSTSLAPGASTTFTVTFTPGAAGTRDAALHVACNDVDENPFDVALTGTGGSPEIVVEQPAGTGLVDGTATIGFGSVNVGSTSAPPVVVTIINSGSASLNGIAVTKDGTNDTDFTVNTTGMSTSLAPLASTTFTVTFTPGALGARAAALHIASNDTDENPFDVNVTGTGADLVTQPPTLALPASATAVTNPVSVDFTLPEAASAGTVKLTFDDGVTPRVLTLAASQETIGNHAFTFVTSNPTATAAIASGPPIPDGTYGVSIQYQDALGNPAALTAAANVVIDTVTQTPTLSAPAASTVTGSPLAVNFTLPEVALSGSVKLTFDDGVTPRVLTLAGSQETAGPHAFTFLPANPLASPNIAGGTPIPDGSYTVTLQYKDLLNNAAASASSTNVVLDTATQAPTLSAPASGTSTSSPVVVQFTLPEVALAGSVKLTFDDGVTPRILTFAGSQETAGPHAFTFLPANPLASPNIVSGPAIPEGTYTVTLQYKDLLNNAAASASSTSVVLDTTTQSPTLAAPATDATTSSPIAVNFTLPEAAAAGTVKLTFDDGVTPRVLTLASSEEGAGAHLFTFLPANPTASSSIADGAPIPDGIYTVSLQYKDALSNAAASASALNVVLDTTTQTPLLTTPATNVTTTSPVAVNYTLPEAAAAGTVKLIFNDGVTPRILTLATAREAAGAHAFTFLPVNPLASSSIASGVAIPAGTYTVSLQYQDVLQNPVASATSTNVVIDLTTQTPTLITPASSTSTTSPVAVSYSLPEAAAPGTVKLTFDDGVTPRVLTLATAREAAGPHSFSFVPGTPLASSSIASGPAIPDGTYTVTLQYQDVLANTAAASSTATDVVIDTVTLAPTLSAPVTGAVTSSPFGISFSLPETAAAGSVKLTFDDGVTPRVLTLAASQQSAGPHAFPLNPTNPTSSPAVASGSAIPDGAYSVTISYQDALGNAAAASSAANGVTIDTTGPNGGNMVLSPASPVDASEALSVQFSGWADPQTPLTYQVLVDNVSMNTPGTSATINFTGPVAPGAHTLKGRITDSLGNITEVTQNFTVNTPTQSWRELHFGTTANSGIAADDFDYDSDSLDNLLEFAMHLDPTTASVAPTATTLNGATIEFVYERSVAALADGILFAVEWSDSLLSPSWSTAGVTESILSDNGTVQVVKALVPAGSGGGRFVRLKVTRP